MKKNKIIIFLLFAISLLSALFITVGYDYYWHISAGNYMFNNHTILTHDIFSWFLQNKYWVSHEWLFEIIIYIFKLLFGHFNIIIYCILCIFSLLLIIFLNNKNYKKNILFTLFWIMLFIIINSGLILPRPYLLSSVFIAITLYLLYDLRNNKNSRKIYILPIVTILWANIHGGSSNLSYILILIFILTGLFSFNNKYINIDKLSNIQIKKYIVVSILCIIAICINPHGYRMLIYPYENIFNITMHQNITEWQPIVKISPNNYIYFSFIIILLLIIIKSKKKANLIDLVLLIIFTILGIKSFRFSNYLYIISSFFIFNYIKPRKKDINTDIILLITSIIVCIIFILNIPNLQNRIDSKYLSDKMISIIKKEKPKRLFNLYDYGGYLISKDIKVFIDGRADLYSNYNYKDYINISKNINTNKLIKKYKFDYFLIDKRYKIYNYFKDSIDYIKIYEDKNTILYKTKNTH